MSLKNALTGLVDRMFRHSDLDEALGLDDLTRLERGLPLLGETSSMPAPDFGEDGPTMELAPSPSPQGTPSGPPKPHVLQIDDAMDDADERQAVEAIPDVTLGDEDEPWHGASATPDEGWMSKGWTLPEERPPPSSIYSVERVHEGDDDPESSVAVAPASPPRRLVDAVLQAEPPARDLFSDIEDHPGASASFDALEPAFASGVHETRPPIRGTEEITGSRLETLPEGTAA